MSRKARGSSVGSSGVVWCLALAVLLALGVGITTWADGEDDNEPGIMEPVSSVLQGKTIRVPNSDQSIDGTEQSVLNGPVVRFKATETTSLLGHPITRVTSPNDDMRLALQALLGAADGDDKPGMEAAANELLAILLGTTEGRIYDGFAMLNYNRGAYLPDHMPEEYKMKAVRDTGETFISPFDGEERKIWEVDVAMLYYDGNIDSDTFLPRFPVDAHPDDSLRVNYRIFSLVQEDFSPTLVMLDRRQAMNTVQFPFKGMDAVWVAFDPGEVLDMSLNYPPIRMLRGVYTWGWRIHPPRIQFLQPVYEMVNANTNEVELDPQGYSYAYRNRTNLTLENIGNAAPEMKMYQVAQAVLAGANGETIKRFLTEPDQGPKGTWVEWSDLVKVQTQLPQEAWDILAAEGLSRGEYGDYNMISVFMNNEMYGEGPFDSEIKLWEQGETFKVKLINLDNHTHYFRNVDFGPRLHDDIQRCCGGGETSFEIMNFKPSYGAPKVAEMQWRAGWGFRPHYNVIQQQGVFPRGADRARVAPYTGGFGQTFFGYQYTEAARKGDFRFNPPDFIVSDEPIDYVLRGSDGQNGLVIGQFTEGYGVAQMCPEDNYPGFCTSDISAYNPNGVKNWPAPNDPTVEKTELRYPPFLRNPAQGEAGAGDIIPPTGAWRPFLWINPNNGTLLIDPEDESKGYWADLTYGHGAPIYAGQDLLATIELPRASGQVFYQFDDLFHDNSIFSPHPVSNGLDEQDEEDAIVGLSTFTRGNLRVRGNLSELSNGKYAEWVTLYDGGAGANGCAGDALLAAPVRPEDGFFVFRCSQARCSSPLVAGKVSERAPSGQLCIQSTVGGFAEMPIE